MKYIDADKLIERLEKIKEIEYWNCGETGVFNEVQELITSLQQEQPEFPTTDEEVEKALASIPKVELPDKYKTPDWLFKQQEQPEVDLNKEVEFYCINKKVKMTIQELINYYIDTECAETAIECGF